MWDKVGPKEAQGEESTCSPALSWEQHCYQNQQNMDLLMTLKHNSTISVFIFSYFFPPKSNSKAMSAC